MELGFGEILVVLVVVLLLFGPSRLPQLGASLGEAIRGFKKGMNSLDDDKAKPAAAAASATPAQAAYLPAPQGPAASVTVDVAGERRG